MAGGDSRWAGWPLSPLALAACLAWVTCATHAHAQTHTVDQSEELRPGQEAEPGRSHYRLDSDSVFVAYRIRSPFAPVTIERRRFVETFSMQHVLQLGELDTQGRTDWSLVSEGGIRIDQDFGEDCETDERCFLATDPDSRRSYQALARRTRLDVPSLSVSLMGPRATRVRAGRQLVLDGAGFVRFDGLSAQTKPHRLLDLQLFGGSQVLGTTVAGSSGFAPQGSIQVALPEDLSYSVPYVQEPTRVWVGGARARVGDERIVRGEMIFREQRDESGLVMRRVGAALTSRPVEALRLSGRLLVDPKLGRVVDALGEVQVTASALSVRGRVIHHEPSYDLGSIWAYFDLIPVQQIELHTEASVGRLRVHGALKGRRAIGDSRERDAGGEVGMRGQLGGYDFGVMGWVWAGDLAPASAVIGYVTRPVRSRGQVGMRASWWYFDDPFRSQVDAHSMAVTATGGFRLTEEARLSAEIEYGYNRVVGHRARGLFALSIRMWR